MCLSAEIARGEGLQRAGGYEPARMLGMGNPKENTRGKCTARGKALRAVLMSELKLRPPKKLFVTVETVTHKASGHTSQNPAKNTALNRSRSGKAAQEKQLFRASFGQNQSLAGADRVCRRKPVGEGDAAKG
jgi:hypothetical protein